MIYIRLNSIGVSSPLKIQIMGNKLFFSAVFIYNIRLPAKKFVHQGSLEFLKFRAKASVDSSAHIREILPGVDPVAPIIQSEFVIQGIQIVMEFFPKIFHKLLLHIFARSSVVFRLIVQLKTDDAFPVGSAFHQFTDHTLRIKKIHRMGNVHNLARAINATAFHSGCKHIRMRLHHPGRNRISGCTDNHIDSRSLHGVHHSFHMEKIKHSRLGLTGTPCRLRNPDSVDSRFFHHFHIFVQAVIWHIFVVVCCSVKKFFHVHPPSFHRLLLLIVTNLGSYLYHIFQQFIIFLIYNFCSLAACRKIFFMNKICSSDLYWSINSDSH